jgi:hypothetical protein
MVYYFCCECCCKKEDPTELQIKEFLTSRAFYDLLCSSLPVFLAAGINNFVGSVIRLISETSEEPEAAELGQALVYALITYFLGKYLNHLIRIVSIDSSYDKSPFVQNIKSLKLFPLFVQLLTENTAFAWKEFMLVFVMKMVFEEDGFGAALGLWIGMVIFFICIMGFSGLWIGYCYRHSKQGKLFEQSLEYDADAFSLGTAVVLTALLGKGFAGIGIDYLDSDSYLYSYEREDDTVTNNTGGSYFALYFSIVLILTTSLLMIEDRFFVNENADSNSPESNIEKQSPSLELETSLTSSHQAESGEITYINFSLEQFQEGLVDYYHNTMGCFCGITYFLFVIDSILVSYVLNERFFFV